MDLSTLSLDELNTLAGEKKDAFDALMAKDNPSTDDVEAAKSLAQERKDIDAAIAAKSDETPEAAQERKDAMAALGAEFTEDAPEEPADEPAEEPSGDEPSGDEPTGEPSGDGGESTEATAQALVAAVEAILKDRAPVTTNPVLSVADVARRTRRPVIPASNDGGGGLSLVASSPNSSRFAPGDQLEGIQGLVDAATAVMEGFTPPNGDGKTVDLKKFPAAKIQLAFDPEVVAKPKDEASSLAAVEAAISMERLRNRSGIKGDDGANSLVAAGGWCAPSETLYDLPADESTDGLLSLPEMQVSRGGIRYTLGPQFADFYAEAGFVQTEAQAAAGTAKPCYEVDCPSFTEVRMDAVGVCIKVPILTQSAYPELTNRFMSGTLVAHQHMVNANVIGRIVTSAGAARDFGPTATPYDGTTTSRGATFTDSLAAFQLVAEQRRQTYRLPFNRAVEAVVPHWVLGMFRVDMARRANISPADPITDALIDAWFRAFNINIQYVYDWQDLSLTAEVYPATFNALIYPAGTFVKGVSDVINLSAVYDAASLSTNVYTGLFMEQGLLVARRQYAADLVTIPVMNAGRTGAQNLASTVAG